MSLHVGMSHAFYLLASFTKSVIVQPRQINTNCYTPIVNVAPL
jgi:hypothetical protein